MGGVAVSEGLCLLEYTHGDITTSLSMLDYGGGDITTSSSYVVFSLGLIWSYL